MAEGNVAGPLAPPNKAEFVDNRELTLAKALCAHLDWLFHTYSNPICVDIATGYFNPEGFALLADRLDLTKEVRLLLGAEPIPPAALPVRMPGDPTGTRFEQKLLLEALDQQEEGLERDRNLLAFSQPVERNVRRLLEFLKSGKLKIRRYEKSFMHGKAYIFSNDDEGVIAGSSNFTAAGLTRNLELNLGRYDPTPVAKVKHWFETLWNDAGEFDLGAVYSARYEAYPPYLIFLRVLWERYGQDLQDEAEEPDPRTVERIRLTTFQTDGIDRAHRILARYNGVLIADGVGLGKTFVGGDILRRVIEDNRQRAVLIAPAALRDGTWERFQARYQLHFEVLSYEQLAADKQVGTGPHSHLKFEPRDYSLIMVDEAQAFRNPATERAQALRKLLAGKPPKKLVLMSATPVNNSLWDLYYLITLFAKQDAAFAGIGIRSLRERFAHAMDVNPDDLTPDLLFDLLDATTVRRTRHFVQRFYPNELIPGPKGELIPVRFPEPHVAAVNYKLDQILPGFFAEFEEALDPPDNRPPKLSLARYLPSKYLKGAQAASSTEIALVGLIRSGLLKRFESSAHAFRLTTEKMADACDVFLEGLKRGVVLTAAGISEWQQTDSDEALDAVLSAGEADSASRYRVVELAELVEADGKLLRDFGQAVSHVTHANDPKLHSLKAELLEILAAAKREETGEQNERNRRKVIIFSFYADTARWICDYLTGLFAADQRFAAYRDRMACIVGDESLGVSRAAAVYGFAPESSEAPAGHTDDLYDVLITTDVLSEGMNLQQCRNIINYDLPWNPMRLVQRHGRVDRIGSRHKDVYLRCFFPDNLLDNLLQLESRIREKVSRTAASVGVEGEVIPGAATSDLVFADVRQEIEKLQHEDATLFKNGGEDPQAHSGEEYRQELRKGMELYGAQVRGIPWGSGSAMRGKRPGHFFCARVGDRIFFRFVPAGSTEMERDTLTCLRIIYCVDGTSVADGGPQLEAAYAAWSAAAEDIHSEWSKDTDPANLQPKVRPALRAAAEQVRTTPPPGLSPAEVNRLVESLEAPWAMRIERQIREAAASASGIASSVAIAEAVKRLGLEPFHAPSPLPPITREEVRLVCWMEVIAASSS